MASLWNAGCGLEVGVLEKTGVRIRDGPEGGGGQASDQSRLKVFSATQLWRSSCG